MNFTRNITAAALLTSGLLATSLPVLADVETTTVKTTTVTSNEQPFVLPSTNTYVLIDPITGSVKGNFDPTRGLSDTHLSESGVVIINQVTGRVMATVDANGRTIALTSAPAFGSLISAIDLRHADLDRMITDDLKSGNMDAAEANALRTESSRIAMKEQTAKQSGDGLSYSEALQIAMDLNQLGDRLVPFAPKNVVTPLLGARMINSDGQLVVVDDIEYRKVQLRQRMDDEYTAGKLSAQQVANLKDQLNAAASLETKYKKNGELSPSASEKISRKLDNVKTKLDQDVAYINDKRSKIGLRVD